MLRIIIVSIWLLLTSIYTVAQSDENARNSAITTLEKITQKAKGLYNDDQYEQAIQVLDQGIDSALLVISIDSSLAVAYHELGKFYYGIDNFVGSIKNWEQSLEIRQNIFLPNHVEIIKLYRNIGNSLRKENKWIEAKGSFEQSIFLHLSRSEQNEKVLAKTYNDLSYINLLLEDPDQAYKYLTVAESMYLDLFEDNPYMLDYVYQNLYTYYRTQKDYRSMLETQYKVLKAYRKVTNKTVDDSLTIANCYNNIGIAYDLMDSLNLSLKFHNKSLTINEKYEDFNQEELAKNYTNLAHIYQKKGQFRKALASIDTAIKYDQLLENNQIGLSNSLATKSNLLLEQNKIPESLIFINQATKLLIPNDKLQFVNDKSTCIENLSDKIKILATLAKDKNIDLLKEAVQVSNQIFGLINQIRSGFYSDASKKFLSAKSKNIFEQAIQINLQLYELTKEEQYKANIFDIMERSKSIALLDALQEAGAKKKLGIDESLLDQERAIKQKIAYYERLVFQEVGDVTLLNDTLLQLNQALISFTEDSLKVQYPKYYQTKYDNTLPNLASLQQNIEGSFLEYFVGDSTIYIFAFTKSKNKTDLITIPLDFPLSDWIYDLRRSIFRPHLDTLGIASKEAYRDTLVHLAHQLYNKIVLPIIDQQDLEQKLTIIPDGVLAYLPFDLLLQTRPKNLKKIGTYDYLLRQHQISYNSSYALLLEMEQQKEHSATIPFIGFAPTFTDKLPDRLLAASTSNTALVSIRSGLGPLFYNIPEVENIQQQLGGQVFIGEKATLDNFTEFASTASILHLATHGKANDISGAYSWLAFANAQDKSKSNYLFNSDLYQLELPVDMVVLSACETGIGELHKGEGVISLARGFSYAGAKSIIPSLWNVNDAQTNTLMNSFYTYLQQGKAKDVALHQAKIDYLDNFANKAHPFYWAAFVPIGDMRPIYWDYWPYLKIGSLLIFLGLIAFGWNKIRRKSPN